MTAMTAPSPQPDPDRAPHAKVVVDTSDGTERFLKGSARMFESDFLERFSHVHPAIPAVMYVPVALASIAVGFVGRLGEASPARIAGAVALQVLAGYVAWTLFEYWLHRLVFHLPVVGRKTARAYFLIHGVHHDWPWDTSRLVIPPGASVFLCAVFFGLFRLLFGAPAMYGYFAGFVAGYVFYDTAHWYVHARVPRSRFGRWLRREHMIHHFKSNTTRFGVSCPWWDYVFRTTGAPDTATPARATSTPHAAGGSA
jgi:dihydroceramide fatty acyl 2-hydroxylase